MDKTYSTTVWCLDCVSVSQALRENTYPFLAMIMLKDRRMTVVGRLEGLIQPEDLINQLTFIMDANQTHLMSERLERYWNSHNIVLHPVSSSIGKDCFCWHGFDIKIKAQCVTANDQAILFLFSLLVTVLDINYAKSGSFFRCIETSEMLVLCVISFWYLPQFE